MSFWKNTFSTPSGYARVIERTAGMVKDGSARRLAKKHGLDILNLTWEDTGRFKGSSVGPNISDMTIQVEDHGTVTCMPVIRFPNFTDKTADVALDKLRVRVGNERGLPLNHVTLREYLGDLRRYLTKPSSWSGDARSLLAPRDRDVLVSAQACFLPVPKDGKAQFNPVLFNYQSSIGSPAVLTVLVTREGTSCTIIDNKRDAFTAGARWGQRLFFNNNGQRASLTGARLEEFARDGGDSTDRVHDVADAKKRGVSQVLLIQVPLVQPRATYADDEDMVFSMSVGSAAPACRRRGGSVDEAVIGHGAAEGPFTEIDGLAIERDERFPIRVTVQFYKATDDGVVTEDDLAEIARQIDGVYRDGSAIGSLVSEGDTQRRTEWDDDGRGKAQTPEWWANFWRRRERETGQRREDLMNELERLLGYRPKDQELEAAIRRVFGVGSA